MRLSIEHPRTHERLVYFAPTPPDFSDFLAARGINFAESTIAALVKEYLSDR